MRAQDFPPFPQSLTGFLQAIPPPAVRHADRSLTFRRWATSLQEFPDRDIMASRAQRFLWICSLDFTRLPISSCAHEMPCQRGQRSGSSVTSQGRFPSIFGLMCASPTCGSALAFVRLWNPATLPLSSPAAPQRDSSDIPRS